MDGQIREISEDSDAVKVVMRDSGELITPHKENTNGAVARNNLNSNEKIVLVPKRCG